ETERRSAMRNLAAVQDDDVNRPKGIQRTRRLPDPALGALWDSIILDEALKSQLVSQAVLNFTLRGKVARNVLPLHGAILLVGPPRPRSRAGSRIARPSPSRAPVSASSKSSRTR